MTFSRNAQAKPKSGGATVQGVRLVGWGAFMMDAVSWTIGILLASALRYDFSVSRITWSGLVLFVAIAVAVQFLMGSFFHVYTGRYQAGEFEEVRAISFTFISTGFITWIPSLVFGPNVGVSRSVILIAMPIALVMSLGLRYLIRVTAERERHPEADAVPALVFGAGFVGSRLVRWMSSDSLSSYRPVGLIDDSPQKQNMHVKDIAVLGTLEDLSQIASETGAEVLVVAIAKAPASLLRKVQDSAKAAGMTVKVMPPMEEIVNGKVHAADLRDLSVEDLLGRAVVDTNVSEIAGYLSGKTVLVTGAGGSIGSQLCVEIAKYGPKELIMLDRDETGLQTVQIGTKGNGLLDTNEVVLADIRDSEEINKIFKERKPNVVFHAAALKHLPMLEQYPDEAWKTNIIGSLNVLHAAEAAGVTTFVNISTDKAANPTSVLGHSKRVAEKLTSFVGGECDQRYISVRFGNVIGSRGSMLPTFTRLIQEGKPVTVTHPDITRYFMTVPEACQLVLQAGGIGSTGEVLILDMGEPVRILDIAQRMIAMSGKHVDIVFTGLREGEKMNEELVGDGETEHRPYHPKISHSNVSPIDPSNLDKARWDSTIQNRDLRAGHINQQSPTGPIPDATKTVPFRPVARY